MQQSAVKQVPTPERESGSLDCLVLLAPRWNDPRHGDSFCFPGEAIVYRRFVLQPALADAVVISWHLGTLKTYELDRIPWFEFLGKTASSGSQEALLSTCAFWEVLSFVLFDYPVESSEL